MPDLETDRLRLHAVTAEEAGALHAGVLPEGWSYAEGYPLPDTRDGVGLFLRHGDRDYGFHLVVRREDECVIGEIGFVEPPKGGSVTIGYAIVPSARRQGYATEAIEAVAEWSLAQRDVTCVRAQTLPDNEASIRALRRAGFEEDDPGPKVRRFVRAVRTAG
ncbi:MAG: GNAT family N-acetyltransferase [Verrucomicrobiota bacterium]